MLMVISGNGVHGNKNENKKVVSAVASRLAFTHTISEASAQLQPGFARGCRAN